MLKTILAVALLFFFIPTFAQFNDSTHYRFRFAGTGSLNKTNDSKAYLFSNGITFNSSYPKTVLTTTANWIYGEQSRQLTNNDFAALANLDFRKGLRKMYYWGLANYQTSYSLKIYYKIQSGMGIGYSLIDSPKTHISLSDGFLYEANNLQDATAGKEVYSTIRNSFRLKYHFVIKDIISLNGTDFVQPSILSLNDYILNFNNDVSVKLRRWLNLTAALNYNRLNRTNLDNLLVTFGISIDNYF